MTWRERLTDEVLMEVADIWGARDYDGPLEPVYAAMRSVLLTALEGAEPLTGRTDTAGAAFYAEPAGAEEPPTPGELRDGWIATYETLRSENHPPEAVLVWTCELCGYPQGTSHHATCPRAEPAGAEPQRPQPTPETFTEEGWALTGKDYQGQTVWADGHGTVTEQVQHAMLWPDQATMTGWHADNYQPVYLTRTVTVQVHEPAPRSEP